MAIVYVGIDFAKNAFAGHAVDERGRPALVRPAVARARLHELIASLPPCGGDGSVLGRPPLGAPVCPVRPHRSPDWPRSSWPRTA